MSYLSVEELEKIALTNEELEKLKTIKAYDENMFLLNNDNIHELVSNVMYKSKYIFLETKEIVDLLRRLCILNDIYVYPYKVGYNFYIDGQGWFGFEREIKLKTEALNRIVGTYNKLKEIGGE